VSAMIRFRIFDLTFLLAIISVPVCSAMAERPRAPRDTTLDSLLTNPKVDWKTSDIEPSVLIRLHMRAGHVPPFPNEDPRLVNPRTWPAVAVFDGAPCSLRVETGEKDAIWYVNTLDDVQPGARFGLSYYSAAKGTPGPTYSWRGDGTLWDRLWRDPKIAPEYMYYRSGELFRFISGRYVDGFDSLDEIFARDGTLIACVFDSGSGRKYYWMGGEVEDDKYFDRALPAQGRALK
jgi:hypothetical protein